MTDLTEEYTLKRELEKHDGLSALELRRDEDGMMRYLPRVEMPASTGEIIGTTDEGRPQVANEDGSISTERTITVDIDGGWYNIPTMYGGKVLSDEEARKIAIDNGLTDPETGRSFDAFSTVDEAVAAAQARSNDLGGNPVTPEERANMAQYGDMFDPDNPAATISSYEPSMREDARAWISETLTDLGTDPLQARDWSERIMGNETSMSDMGIGIADLVGVGEIMGIEEGLRQFDRGYQSDDLLDMGIGAVISVLNAAGLRGQRRQY